MVISGRGMSKSSDPEEFFSTFVIWGSYLRGEISSFAQPYSGDLGAYCRIIYIHGDLGAYCL